MYWIYPSPDNEIMLSDALYVPSYKQNILSVRAAGIRSPGNQNIPLHIFILVVFILFHIHLL